MERLLVAALGNQNSGKSHTWNALFGHTVKTGQHERPLPLGNNEYVNVFLISGSPEERGRYVDEIIQGSPRIVLCSLQYTDGVQESFEYFFRNRFFAVTHWLNPGFCDPDPTEDRLELIPYLLRANSLIGIRDGKEVIAIRDVGTIDATNRVEEMRDFIRGWHHGEKERSRIKRAQKYVETR